MSPLRRYRVFLAIVVLVVIGWYQFIRIKPTQGKSLEFLDRSKYHEAKEPERPIKIEHEQDNPIDSTPQRGEEEGVFASDPVAEPVDSAVLEASETTTSLSSSLPTNDHGIERPTDQTEPRTGTPEKPPDGVLRPHSAPHSQQDSETEESSQSSSVHPVHWMKYPEHFPIPSESVIPLPTAMPRDIPRIQHAKGRQSKQQREKQDMRLAAVKEALMHTWNSYKQHAWLHDELRPITGGVRNPFCGWAATLVDTLDTLWIMGLKDEFDEAAKAVAQIDFTTSHRDDIPLFETTIRYLGGLLSAYDLSNGKYRVLLEKAVELADVLLSAFDTPNRMPMTFYEWRPVHAAEARRAPTHAVLSEIGSLSVEFTRLAQITKEPIYYDAVARITNEFEAWQNHTRLPGMWPLIVDTSGCKKPPPSSVPEDTYSAVQPPPIDRSSADATQKHPAPKEKGDEPKKASSGQQDTTNEELKRNVQSSDTEQSARLQPRDCACVEEEPKCEPQGLASPPDTSRETFSLGGQSDSMYEYLPKQYMLLGGVNEQYRSMYERAVDVVKRYLLFRPMTIDNRDILLAGSVTLSDLDHIDFTPEGTHLTCFAGGMFAIGSKIFDRPDELELAKKLTDGCIWAYESTTTGIMPEKFIAIPCRSTRHCLWNESMWWDSLDPWRQQREDRPTKEELLSSLESPTGGLIRQILDKTKPPHEASTAELEDSVKVKRQLQSEELVDNKDLPPNKPREGGSEADANVHGDSGSQKIPFIEKAPARGQRTSNQEHDDKKITAEKQGPQPQPQPEYPLAPDKNAKEKPPADGPKGTPIDLSFIPALLATHEEYVQFRIKEERLPPGFVDVPFRKYILRPEAIESVFILYRITGDDYWREKGWEMFVAIQRHTRTLLGNTAIRDVTSPIPEPFDEMESFWTAETLKYFYLLFSPEDVISLDDYVFNTEAHPFKRPHMT